ncbi:hypothetical protein, partial [Marinagarivorans algicola]|uniref:hypothetical protein n=1 Tax=Marinagarivorans algicola TaxID=1513270 RepID=UPI001EE4A303
LREHRLQLRHVTNHLLVGGGIKVERQCIVVTTAFSLEKQLKILRRSLVFKRARKDSHLFYQGCSLHTHQDMNLRATL